MRAREAADTPLARGGKQTKPESLIPAVTEAALNETRPAIIRQQNSYATRKAASRAQDEGAATSRSSATSKDI